MDNPIEGATATKLSDLLRHPDFEKLELALKEPNLFQVLDVGHRETRHSNFLGWLLDPSQSHGLQDIFLRKILRDVFNFAKQSKYTVFDVETFDLNNIEVKREFSTSKGRIDVMIIHRDFVIVLENKVDSTEHSGQLRKYREVVEQEYSDRAKYFVLLTLTGQEAQQESESQHWSSLSYNDIVSHLDQILQVHNWLSQKVRMYIVDYVTILKREFMSSDSLSQDAVKIYRAHKDALDFIFENKPDDSSRLRDAFGKRISDRHWRKLGAKDYKGMNQFLPPGLQDKIRSIYPVDSNEFFYFELHYYATKGLPEWIRLRAVIWKPFCRDEAFAAITKALNSAMPTEFRESKSQQWQIYLEKKIQLRSDFVGQSDADLHAYVDEIWSDKGLGVDKWVEKVVTGFDRTITGNSPNPVNY